MGFLDKLTGFGTKISGAVSPFLSLASGVGSLFGNKNIDKQIKAQQQENQKNREYNLMLAQMQNEMSQDQWERENEYNLPINQRKRLEDAGLNADLMYGNGGVQNIGASSPAMTSGAPSSPADMSPLGQKKTIGDVVNNMLQTEMVRAQIDKVKAETRSESYQGDILASDASFRDAINRGSIDLTNVNIRLGSSKITLTDAQVSEVRTKISNLEQQTSNLIAEYDKIRASVRNLDIDNALRIYYSALDTEKAKAEIKRLSAASSLDYAQADEIVKTLPLKLLGLQSSHDLNLANIGHINASTSKIDWDLSQAKSYEEVERTTNIITDITDALFPIAALIGTAFGGDSYEENYHETRVDKNGDVSERYGSRKKKR